MQIRAGDTTLVCLRPGRDVRFSGPRRALRKLVVAAGGDPGGAVVPAVFRGRRAGRAIGRSTSSCRSAWWCWSDWPARTRSSSSSLPGTCTRQGQPRYEATRGGLAAAAAADPHDLVRLHPGRRPAGDRHGRRGRDAAIAGNGRLQRHDRRDALRHLPDPRLLLRHSRLSARLRFFTAVAAQWIGSALFGGLSGAAIGFLLSRLGVARWPWSIVVGGGLGILVGLAVLRHSSPTLHETPAKKVSP